MKGLKMVTRSNANYLTAYLQATQVMNNTKTINIHNPDMIKDKLLDLCEIIIRSIDITDYYDEIVSVIQTLIDSNNNGGINELQFCAL